MVKVLLSFLLISFGIQASTGLNQMLVFEKCQADNCQQLKATFNPETFSLKENSNTPAQIKELKVLENKARNTYFIELKLTTNKDFKLTKDNVLVYRHQVLSPKLISTEKNLIKANITFKKDTPLSKVNEYCMKLNKTCKWIHQLDRF